MAGQMCNGVAGYTSGELKNSRAYCEGMAYRATGTLLGAPVTGNPHVAGSEASVSWIAGWDFAEAASGGAIDSTGTCCAVSGTILA